MNYKHGWKKEIDEYGNKIDTHPQITRECMGYCSTLVSLKTTGKKIWIQEKCEVKFKTRDYSKQFCSLKCRVNYHRMLKRIND